MAGAAGAALDIEALRARMERTEAAEPEEGLKSPRASWRWLLRGEHPDDAAELAELLHEAAPTLGPLAGFRRASPPPAGRAPGGVPRSLSQEWPAARLRARLAAAAPAGVAPGQVPWEALQEAVSSELLAAAADAPPAAAAPPLQAGAPPATPAAGAAAGPAAAAPSPPRASRPATPTADLVEINSGGRVLFLLFEPDADAAAPTPPVSRVATAEPGEGPPPSTPPCVAPREAVAVAKFVPTRLLCQSEQFANELARHVGLCAPASRVLRAAGAASEREWAAAAAAAAEAPRARALTDEMARAGCCLVIEFVPGRRLFDSPAAFASGSQLRRTVADLGRLLALDMLLGNADRLPCEALGWRGNAGNVLFSPAAGRLVAIDALVQRRPPGGLVSAEDAACERVVELALNDGGVAALVLREAVGASAVAVAAVDAAGAEAVDAFRGGLRAGLAAAGALKGLVEMMLERVSAWIAEFIADVEAAAPELAAAVATPRGVAGLGSARRRTMHADGGSGGGGGGAGAAMLAAGSGGSGAGAVGATPFAAAAAAGAAPEPLAPRAAAAEMDTATTQAIRAIAREAARDATLGERVAGWKAAFRARSEELRAAVEAWEQRQAGARADVAAAAAAAAASDGPAAEAEAAARALAAALGVGADADADADAGTSSAGRLTTGFLDGASPVVDLYELKVRLEHMLQRLRVLQRAAASARPARAAPGVFVSGAVGAASRHVLRHLGVTHVLNATADLLMLDADDGFETMRVPLRDEVEEELGPHLAAACAFIDAGLAAGGAVLVHCHQGASRSCSLVLAWTMARQRLPLARALELMRAAHPPAAPNRGYMAALGALEEELFGETTVPPDRVRRTKPEPRACPECGAVVGLSAESVAVHMRLKHAPAARGLSSPRAPEALGERG
jgi:predicted protein tyrosine phosphatase